MHYLCISLLLATTSLRITQQFLPNHTQLLPNRGIDTQRIVRVGGHEHIRIPHRRRNVASAGDVAQQVPGRANSVVALQLIHVGPQLVIVAVDDGGVELDGLDTTSYVLHQIRDRNVLLQSLEQHVTKPDSPPVLGHRVGCRHVYAGPAPQLNQRLVFELAKRADDHSRIRLILSGQFPYAGQLGSRLDDSQLEVRAHPFAQARRNFSATSGRSYASFYPRSAGNGRHRQAGTAIVSACLVGLKQR